MEGLSEGWFSVSVTCVDEFRIVGSSVSAGKCRVVNDEKKKKRAESGGQTGIYALQEDIFQSDSQAWRTNLPLTVGLCF